MQQLVGPAVHAHLGDQIIMLLRCAGQLEQRQQNQNLHKAEAGHAAQLLVVVIVI